MQRGDSHYHCFGCGAHGDAIAFLMSHVKMGFVEAIEVWRSGFKLSSTKSMMLSKKKGRARLASTQAFKKGVEAAIIYCFIRKRASGPSLPV